MLDLTGSLIGLLLTLLTFSYVIKDNVLFRLAIHIFIGVAAGFAALITWHSVIWPRLIRPILEWDGTISAGLYLVFPLFLALLLFTKLIPKISALGNSVLAYLVGVAAATAIGGGIIGTLFPQMIDTINLFQMQPDSWSKYLNPLIILVGTLTTLIYFHFGAQRSKDSGRAHPDLSEHVQDFPEGSPGSSKERAPWIRALASIGHYFIAIAFGSLFAGVLIASLTVLVNRVDFVISFILSLLRY